MGRCPGPADWGDDGGAGVGVPRSLGPVRSSGIRRGGGGRGPSQPRRRYSGGVAKCWPIDGRGRCSRSRCGRSRRRRCQRVQAAPPTMTQPRHTAASAMPSQRTPSKESPVSASSSCTTGAPGLGRGRRRLLAGVRRGGLAGQRRQLTVGRVALGAGRRPLASTLTPQHVAGDLVPDGRALGHGVASAVRGGRRVEAGGRVRADRGRGGGGRCGDQRRGERCGDEGAVHRGSPW